MSPAETQGIKQNHSLSLRKKPKSKTQLLTSLLQSTATHENIYVTTKTSPISPKLIRFFCFTGFRQEVSQTQIMLFIHKATSTVL